METHKNTLKHIKTYKKHIYIYIYQEVVFCIWVFFICRYGFFLHALLFCLSTNEVFKNSDVIITCLPTEKSLLEICNNISSKKLIIETSTLPVECKNNAKKFILKNGSNIVDAPVSGNRISALNGQLSSYLSGAKKDKQIASMNEVMKRKKHSASPGMIDKYHEIMTRGSKYTKEYWKKRK